MIFIKSLSRSSYSASTIAINSIRYSVVNKNSVSSSTSSLLLNQFIRKMHLLQNKTLIDGKWISAINNAEFTVLNPVNGNVIGSVPDMDSNDTQIAINAAKTAFRSPQWSALTGKERSGLLKVFFFFIK